MIIFVQCLQKKMMAPYRILLNKEQCHADMEPFIITEEVVNLLNTLQPNKASGPDKIPSRFLKEYRLSYPQF